MRVSVRSMEYSQNLSANDEIASDAGPAVCVRTYQDDVTLDNPAFRWGHVTCDSARALYSHIRHPSHRLREQGDGLGRITRDRNRNFYFSHRAIIRRVSNFIYPSSSLSSPSSLLCTLVCLVTLVSVILLPTCQCAALRRARTSAKAIREKNVLDFLSKFGYLHGPTRETGNLLAPSELVYAIKRFQRFARIPETGKVDHRTLEFMHKPRCGNLDITHPGQLLSRRKKRFTLAPSHWKKRHLTFRIHDYTPDLNVSDVRTAIYHALHVWAKVTQMDFTEVMHGDADIRIRFARRYHHDGYPFDGTGKVLAHAFFPGEDKGGDTHFDDDEHWTLNSDEEGVDLYMVAAHEFGHALGLSHSNVKSALMYPWYQGYQVNFQLPHDDVLGIQQLYGVRHTPPNTNLPSMPPFPTRPPNSGDRSGTTRKPQDIDPEGSIPNPCTMSYDAVTLIRREVYIFRQRWFWRLNNNGVVQGYPIKIQQFWYGLPTVIDHIDAVYEREDGLIVFFIGDHYWKLNANHRTSGFPATGRPITEFGIPADVKHIDAVFVWGYNKRTYLISGDMYWKLDDTGVAEYDYPRDMSMWAGVQLPVDGAFQFYDGKTYFFKGSHYWQFNDLKMRVKSMIPAKSSKKWMKCDSNAIRQRATTDSVNVPSYAITGESTAKQPSVASAVSSAVSLASSKTILYYLTLIILAYLYHKEHI